MNPPDKIYRLQRTTLSREQLLRNAEALVHFANGGRVEYYSPVLRAWTECWCVDVEFEHRVKPPEEPPTPAPAVSTNVEDY